MIISPTELALVRYLEEELRLAAGLTLVRIARSLHHRTQLPSAIEQPGISNETRHTRLRKLTNVGRQAPTLCCLTTP